MRSLAIVTILQRVMDIIDPSALPAPPKKAIGFQAFAIDLSIKVFLPAILITGAGVATLLP